MGADLMRWPFRRRRADPQSALLAIAKVVADENVNPNIWRSGHRAGPEGSAKTTVEAGISGLQIFVDGSPAAFFAYTSPLTEDVVQALFDVMWDAAAKVETDPFCGAYR